MPRTWEIEAAQTSFFLNISLNVRLNNFLIFKLEKWSFRFIYERILFVFLYLVGTTMSVLFILTYFLILLVLFCFTCEFDPKVNQLLQAVTVLITSKHLSMFQIDDSELRITFHVFYMYSSSSIVFTCTVLLMAIHAFIEER